MTKLLLLISLIIDFQFKKYYIAYLKHTEMKSIILTVLLTFPALAFISQEATPTSPQKKELTLTATPIAKKVEIKELDTFNSSKVENENEVPSDKVLVEPKQKKAKITSKNVNQ